jgi:isopropylmalate/homocitrate/citramalate synthase
MSVGEKKPFTHVVKHNGKDIKVEGITTELTDGTVDLEIKITGNKDSVINVGEFLVKYAADMGVEGTFTMGREPDTMVPIDVENLTGTSIEQLVEVGNKFENMNIISVRDAVGEIDIADSYPKVQKVTELFPGEQPIKKEEKE